MSKQDKFYETLRQTQTNTFSDGLNMDLHPLTTPNTILTDCVNGTMITYNDNEFVLQNDRGNSETNCVLTKGYYPVAMKEYNGVLYIISHNPENQTTEIGSYPSPTQNNDHLELDQVIEYPWLKLADNGSQINVLDSDKDYYIKTDLETGVVWFDQKEKQRVSMIDNYILEVEESPLIYKLQFYAKSIHSIVENIELHNSENNKPKHFPNKYLAYLGYEYITPSIDNIKFVRTDSGNPKENGDNLTLEYIVESSDKFLYDSIKTQLNAPSPNFALYLYTRSYFYNEESEFDLMKIVSDKNSNKNYIKWSLNKVEEYGSTCRYFFTTVEFNDGNNPSDFEKDNYAPKIYWPSDDKFAYDFEKNELNIRGAKYTHFCVEAYPVIEFLHKEDDPPKKVTKTFFLEKSISFNTEVQNVVARNERFSEFFYNKNANEDLEIKAVLNVENFFNKKLTDKETTNIVCNSAYVNFNNCYGQEKEVTNANVIFNNINWQQKDNCPTGIEGTSTGIMLDDNANSILAFSKYGSEAISGGISEQCSTIPSSSNGMYTNPNNPSVQYGDTQIPACDFTVNGKYIKFSYTVPKDKWKTDTLYEFELCFDVAIDNKMVALKTDLNVDKINFNNETNITVNATTQLSQPSIIKLTSKGVGENVQKALFPVITTNKMLTVDSNDYKRMDQLSSSYWFDISISDFIESTFNWDKATIKNNIKDLGGEDVEVSKNWLNWLSNYDNTSVDNILVPSDSNFDPDRSVIPYYLRSQNGSLTFSKRDNLPSIYQNICKLQKIDGQVTKRYTTWSTDATDTIEDINAEENNDRINIDFQSIQYKYVGGDVKHGTLGTKRHYIWPYVDPKIGILDNLQSPERKAYTLYRWNSFHIESECWEDDNGEKGLRFSAGITPGTRSCARNLVGDAIDWYYEFNDKLSAYFMPYGVVKGDPRLASEFVFNISEKSTISYLNFLFSIWQWCPKNKRWNSGTSDYPFWFRNDISITNPIFGPWGLVNDGTDESRLYARCLPYIINDQNKYTSKYLNELDSFIVPEDVQDNKDRATESFFKQLSNIYNTWIVGCENLEREQFDKSMKTLCSHCYYTDNEQVRYYYEWNGSTNSLNKWIANISFILGSATISISDGIKNRSWESKNNFSNYSISGANNPYEAENTEFDNNNLGEYVFEVLSSMWHTVNNGIDVIKIDETNPFKRNSQTDYIIKCDLKTSGQYWNITNKTSDNWEPEALSSITEPLDYNNLNDIWTLRKDKVNDIDRAMIYCRFLDTNEDSQHFINGDLNKRLYYKTSWIFDSTNYNCYNKITPKFYKWYKDEVLNNVTNEVNT